VSEVLIEEHTELARKLAYRYAGRGEPVEELVQVAMLGLVLAARRYDPERGNGFVAFAVPTIFGELRRYFRHQCWAVRIPRPMHDLCRRIGPAREKLQAHINQSPTARELATELDVTQDDVLHALECSSAYSTVTLDAPEQSSDDSGRTIADTVGTDDGRMELIEQREAVRDALAQLPARERRILALRYYRERTQERDRRGARHLPDARLAAAHHHTGTHPPAIDSDSAEPIHWPSRETATPKPPELYSSELASSNGSVAGPCRTVPSVAKREPWQGQSQVCSASLKATMQPRCVQRAETETVSPSALR
jgi:RNA polymerase sigma-B factor